MKGKSGRTTIAWIQYGNLREVKGILSMSSVKVRIGESIDKALRALKKKLDKEGVMKTAKAHRYYDKPSVKSRAKSKAAAKYRNR